MAIQYIDSGDTNNTGRLKINAAFDEIITGITSSSNVGEMSFSQLNGSTLSGKLRFPNSSTKKSRLTKLGLAVSSNSLYFTEGYYFVNNSYVNIPFRQLLTFTSNVSIYDRYDAVILDEDGTIRIQIGTPSATPEVPYITNGAIDEVVVGFVVVKANNGGVLPLTEELLPRVGSLNTNSEYIGGLNLSLLGGYIYQNVSTIGSTPDIYREYSKTNNSIAFGNHNLVYKDNSNIIGGRENEIGPLNTSTFNDYSGNTILGSFYSNIYSSTTSLIIAGYSNEINANDCTMLGGSGNTIGVSGTSSTIIAGQDNTINGVRNYFANSFNNTSSGDADFILLNSNDSEASGGERSFGLNVSGATFTNAIDSGMILGKDNTVEDINNCLIIGGSGNKLTTEDYCMFFNAKDSISSGVGTRIVAINTNSFTASTANTQNYITVVDNLSFNSGLTTNVIYYSGASYDLASNQYGIAVDSNVSATTVNLPVSPFEGETHIIKDGGGNASSNNIIIDGKGNKIDGSDTQTISSNYNSFNLVFNTQFGEWLTI